MIENSLFDLKARYRISNELLNFKSLKFNHILHFQVKSVA